MSLMAFLNAAERRISRHAEARRLASRSRMAGAFTSAQSLAGTHCHCPSELTFHHVHSEGLREAADFVVDWNSNVENPARPQLPPARIGHLAAELGPGTIVHVKADQLAAFREHVLPAIRHPVILVTGDSDMAPVQIHRQLLDHPMIAHWFAQNCDWPAEHPRLSPIPIGLDNPIYTKFEKRLGFLVDWLAGQARPGIGLKGNDTGDQTRFNSVAEFTRASIGQKPLSVLCTFHQNHRLAPDISGMPDRMAAATALMGKSFCHFPAQRLDQEACWRLHSQFAFEASPQGNGMDCFRTWEALALGSIPILRAGPLDRLFREHGLPVVIVQDWNEINEENLAKWAQIHIPQLEAARHRLSNGYWIEMIRNKAQSVARK